MAALLTKDWVEAGLKREKKKKKKRKKRKKIWLYGIKFFF